jgi:hypothetical protein
MCGCVASFECEPSKKSMQWLSDRLAFVSNTVTRSVQFQQMMELFSEGTALNSHRLRRSLWSELRRV